MGSARCLPRCGVTPLPARTEDALACSWRLPHASEDLPGKIGGDEEQMN